MVPICYNYVSANLVHKFARFLDSGSQLTKLLRNYVIHQPVVHYDAVAKLSPSFSFSWTELALILIITFYGPNFFFARIVLSAQTFFSGTNFFLSKFFFCPNFFWPKLFLTQTFFPPKLFFNPNFFWAQNFWGAQTFLGAQTFFWPKKMSAQTLFWHNTFFHA